MFFWRSNCNLVFILKNMLKTIPHLFTLFNLLSGCLAVFFTFSHQFNAALFFVLVGLFFDFFDGFFARILNVESSLGVQLDSLADLVTFGFTPGVMLYQLFILSGIKQVDYSFYLFDNLNLTFSLAPLAVVGYLVTLGAALRLARFNLLNESLSYFKGLATPANAIFIMGIPFVMNHPMLIHLNKFILTPMNLVIICIISFFMMNIHWKMFSLKGVMKEGKIGLIYPILLAIGSSVMFYYIGLAGLSLSVILYVLLSGIKYSIRI